jgi:hypothetical protein
LDLQVVIYLIYFRGHQFSSAIVDVGLEGTEFLALLSQFGCINKNSLSEDFLLAKHKYTNIPTMMEPFFSPSAWF